MNPLSLSNRFENNLKNITEAKLSLAKDNFRDLLSEDSTNIEFQAGFFCVGWWLNREANKNLISMGRLRATWIMKEWKELTDIATNRAYVNTQSFQILMFYVLKEAIENYRLAFIEDGPTSTDPNMLKELGMCLLQIDDIENAIEILAYTKTKLPNDRQLLFLLAQLYCYTGEKENITKGLSIYRDAFIHDFHNDFEANTWEAEITNEVHYTLLKIYKNEHQKMKYWFPSYLMAQALPYKLKPLKDAEIEKIVAETKRLIIEKEKVLLKFKDKLQALLCFYLLVLILQFYDPEIDPFVYQKYEKELYLLSPHLYEFYLGKREGTTHIKT